MRIMKRWSVLLLTGIMVFTLATCGSGAEKVLIGAVLARADEFNLSLERNYRALDAELEDVDILVTVAQDNQVQQIADVESMIAQGAKAIIVRAVDMSAASDMVQMIKDAGVYVVIDDTIPTGVTIDMYDAFCKSQNIAHGENVGRSLKQYIAENPGKQLYLGYIQGLDSVNTLMRHDGIYNIVTKEEVIELDYQIGEWKADKAAAITEGWLTAYPNMNVIACANDTMACAVVETLISAGIDTQNDFLVFGVDGDSNALQYVKAGTLHATSAQDTSISSRVMADMAVKLARGEKIEFDDPAQKTIDPRMIVLVTQDNVDDFIK